MPLLLAQQGRGAPQRYALATATLWTYFAAAYYWLGNLAVNFWGVAPPLNILVMLGITFFMIQPFVLAQVLWSFCERRLPETMQPFAYASLCTLVWDISPAVFKLDTVFMAASSRIELQAIEFTGVHGFHWLVLFINYTIFRCVLAYTQGRLLQKRLMLSAAGILVLWIGWGVWATQVWQERIAGWSRQTIGIVQPNRPAILSAPYYAALDSIFELDMTEEVALQGAQVAIWPEGKDFGYAFRSEVREHFAQRMKSIGIDLIFQTSTVQQDGIGKDQYYNSAVLLRQGEPIAEYHKQERVPFGEYIPAVFAYPLQWILPGYAQTFDSGYEPGTSAAVFPIKGMRLSPLICYESLFPSLAAEAVEYENPAGKVLVVMSQNGWYGSLLQVIGHSFITSLRAIENRVSVIHVVNNGYSSVTLPDGSVHKITPYAAKVAATYQLPFDPRSGGSFFSQYPYLVHILLVVHLLFVLGYLICTRKSN